MSQLQKGLTFHLNTCYLFKVMSVKYKETLWYLWFLAKRCSNYLEDSLDVLFDFLWKSVLSSISGIDGLFAPFPVVFVSVCSICAISLWLHPLAGEANAQFPLTHPQMVHASLSPGEKMPWGYPGPLPLFSWFSALNLMLCCCQRK